MERLQCIAFIDGQNLMQNMRNNKNPWKLDLIKFRVFLREKFGCDKTYYFIGVQPNRSSL